MEPLPPKAMVLEACRTAPHTGHPLLESAHLLAGLHERRARTEPGAAADIDAHRARLVLAIDRWVATEVPPPHADAHMHTETVGMVIDRLAQLSVTANESLSGTPEWAVHDAWERLAELAIGYHDLAFEVSAGFRRLPQLSRPRTYSPPT
ncbi:DUF4254 domain-containing protein [Nocardia sp. NPDC051756]|uniref:DUF4254 domain-containing protein n=1 Tax=Nocardia sp. NPDC051756 TaxID=3154751 RepID=UPI00344150B7